MTPHTRTWNGTGDSPLRWRKPARVLVTCDPFADMQHDDIDRVLAVAALSPETTVMILTDRVKEMRDYFAEIYQLPSHIGGTEDREQRVKELARQMLIGPLGDKERFWNADGSSKVTHAPWPLPNLILGTTVRTQAEADARAPLLLQVPAAVRWLDCRPREALDLTECLPHWRCNICGWANATDPNGTGRCPNRCAFIHKESGVSWLTCSGETGRDAAPMHPQWVRDLRDQAQAAGVPFWFSFWGKPAIGCGLKESSEFKAGYSVKEKHGGNLLDGVAWEQLPEVMR